MIISDGMRHAEAASDICINISKEYLRMVIKPEKKRPKFRFSVIVLFFFMSFAGCFFFYMKNNQYDPEKENPVLTNTVTSQTVQEETSAADPDVTAVPEGSESAAPPPSTNADGAIQLTESAAPAAQPGAVNPIPESQSVGWTYITESNFVGDSITTGLSGYNIVPAELVLASVGMNIDKIMTEPVETPNGSMTVLEALKANKPKNVYIMMGSNGISWMSNDSMISRYSEFVTAVKGALPEADIYVISVPPVTAARETAQSVPIQNSDIDAYNSELLKFANDSGIYYIDLNTALKGNDGKFPAENAAKDGMHFKLSTYDTMLNFIMTHTHRDSSAAAYDPVQPSTAEETTAAAQ